MGLCCCKKLLGRENIDDEDEYEPIEEIEKNIPKDWAQAVNNGEIIGVRYLHADDPDFADKPIDIQGRKALHIAVEKDYTEIVEYLLQNGANVNSKASITGDTPLHEAARINNVSMIRLLLQYGADSDLRNRQQKKPRDLCDVIVRREFFKTKINKYRSERLNNIGTTDTNTNTNTTTNNNNTDTTDTTSDARRGETEKEERGREKEKEKERGEGEEIQIAGQSLQQYVMKQKELKRNGEEEEENSHNNDEEEEEEEEEETEKIRLISSKNNKTEFGRNIGIELDHVSEWLKKLSKKEMIWNRAIGENKKEITQNRILFKLVYTLLLAALRMENRSATLQPNDPYIKSLTKQLQAQCKRTTNPKKEFVLTKDQFINEFHDYLMNVHQDMIAEK